MVEFIYLFMLCIDDDDEFFGKFPFYSLLLLLLLAHNLSEEYKIHKKKDYFEQNSNRKNFDEKNDNIYLFIFF